MEEERRSLGALEKKVANCASLVGVGQQPQGREWLAALKMYVRVVRTVHGAGGTC